MTIRSLSFALLLSALPALAQDPAVGAPPPAAKVAGAPPVTVTMSFAGGTLAEFCAAIRGKEPRANIVIAPLAAAAKVPALDLRGAGIEQALESACAVAESAATIRMKDFRGPGEPVFTILAQEPSPAAKAATAAADAARTGNARLEQTEVFSLNRLLDAKDFGFTVTTVLSAIETACGGAQALADMRFHKESGLLIVRGRPEQIALARDVLMNLDRDVAARRNQDNARKGIGQPPAEAK